MLRARMAALLGTPALYRDMTLVDHLTLIDATSGRDPDTCEDRVQAALSELGLSELASRFPHELSSGPTQLFWLAVTPLRPGDLLVLDEPEQRLHTRCRAQDGGAGLPRPRHDRCGRDGMVDLTAATS